MNFLIKWIFVSFLAFILLFEYGCDIQSRGFALPQGDKENGKEAFFELGCNHCHSAGEIPWISTPENIRVPLGGQVQSIKTYGELVTSIINPSHKISQQFGDQMTTESGVSKMRMYNEVMTVQNLVDIVTFLQDEYDVKPPPAPYYVH